MTWMVNPTSVKRNEVRYEILNVAWKGAAFHFNRLIADNTAVVFYVSPHPASLASPASTESKQWRPPLWRCPSTPASLSTVGSVGLTFYPPGPNPESASRALLSSRLVWQWSDPPSAWCRFQLMLMDWVPLCHPGSR